MHKSSLLDTYTLRGCLITKPVINYVISGAFSWTVQHNVAVATEEYSVLVLFINSFQAIINFPYVQLETQSIDCKELTVILTCFNLDVRQ